MYFSYTTTLNDRLKKWGAKCLKLFCFLLYAIIAVIFMVGELATHPGIENHETFLARLRGVFPENEVTAMDDAYDTAKEAHRGQMRIDLSRYFEHLRATVVILLDEGGVRDPDVIKAALLHDTAEDTKYWGVNPATMFYPAWVVYVQEAITSKFGAKTAGFVLAVTEPQVNNIDILTKEQAKETYYEQLCQSEPEALLVKMADRLHNLRTQYTTPPEKQKQKVRETKEIYLPIFRRAGVNYPEITDYLIGEINKAILALEASFVAHDNGDGSPPRTDVIM